MLTSPKDLKCDVERLLTDADQEWSDGCLARAHELYKKAAKLDPDSWHAAFQVAWLDAAVGPSSKNDWRPSTARA